jgi:cyclophilin family peptidyl-prolyl cis-trans isomerase/HEAT repeat protein
MKLAVLAAMALGLAGPGCDGDGPAPPGRRDAGAKAATPREQAAAAQDADAAGRGRELAHEGPVDGPLASLIRMEDARRLTRPVVDQLVQDSDVVTRRRTLLALGRIGDPEALGPLRAALTEGDPETRQVALASLGQLDAVAHPDAEKVLRAFLDLSQKAADRRVAIESLGRVGSLDSVGPLLQALESPEPRMRASAAAALGQMAARELAPGEQAMVALASHLDDSDVAVRKSAAFALSRCKEISDGARGAIGTALAKALRNDGDAEVRIMSGRAMGALDAGGAGYLLAALENDEDWRVRTAAATALGRRATAKQRARGLGLAWKRLADDPARLTSPDLHVLRALLVEAVARPSPELARALGAIEGGASKTLASSTDPAARLALAHVQCAAALAQDRLKHQPARVARCAAGDPALITEVERKLLVVSALEGSTEPGVQKRLRALADDPDARVRLAVIEALGSALSEGRLNLIEKALADESPAVVAAAAEKLATAVDHYYPKVTRPAERLTVTEHTETGTVVHSMSEPPVKGRTVPVKALAKALERVDADRDVETAVDLIKAVGALKAADAATAVLPFAGHSNRSVRRAARAALNALERDPGPELRPDPPNLVDPAALSRLAGESPSVAVETTRGTFVVQLRPDVAPATTANFLSLVGSGFFEGVTFHRVVPGFVAQTGDPTGTGYGGPGYTIRCELNDLPYERGTLGMALAGDDTGGSQFFVTYSAQPHLDRHYTAFGRVTEGQDVVDSLQPWDRVVRATRR